jgi:hypothetical protein
LLVIRQARLLLLIAAAATLSAAVAACSSEGAPIETPAPTEDASLWEGAVTVTAKRPVVTIRNLTDRTIGYLLIEKGQMLIALYPPCASACEKLVQGATVAVSYSAIDGYTSAAREATLVYWSYVPGPNGALVVDGPVQFIGIQLD